MVGRACSCSQTFHLFDKERHQCSWILDTCLGLLIKVCLVCGSTTFGYAEEAVLHSVGSLNINLCRKVALGIHLIIHIQRSVLRIAQILFGICLVNTQRESLFIAIVGPYLLSLFAMDDSCSSILTQRQFTL